MATVEIAYSLRAAARVFVAAQDHEEIEGWPYEAILGRFREPLDSEAAAEAIVEEARRATALVRTISAVRLTKIAAVVAALETLGGALTPLLSTGGQAIHRARQEVRCFSLLAYVDLLDFAEKLREHLATHAGVVAAAGAVIAAVRAAIIAPRPDAVTHRAHGLSAYVPTIELDPDANGYSALPMCAAAPQWRDFVIALAKAR